MQYPDEGTAEQAKDYLDGHCMYPGSKNKVHKAHGCQQQGWFKVAACAECRQTLLKSCCQAFQCCPAGACTKVFASSLLCAVAATCLLLVFTVYAH